MKNRSVFIGFILLALMAGGIGNIAYTAEAVHPKTEITNIASGGVYSCSDCRLSGDITGTLSFTTVGARIDINGKTVDCGSSGNTVDFGISVPVDGRLFDSTGTGKITNCWAATNLGANATAVGVNIDATRYIGHYINAENVSIFGGSIGGITGVTNEKYAIGVHVSNAANTLVSGTYFYEIYPQTGYAGSGKGEGLAVNFSASSTGGIWRNSVAYNENINPDTYCSFMGNSGTDRVENVSCVNYRIGHSGDANDTVRNTILVLKQELPGSQGVSLELGANAAGNVVMGYALPFYSRGHTNSFVFPSN